MVGNDDDLIRVFGVYLGVAQGTAGRIAVGAVRVAVGVCARGAEEGDVDVNLAGFNGTRAPAVRTDDDRLFHQAVGDCGADLVAQFLMCSMSGSCTLAIELAASFRFLMPILAISSSTMFRT